MAQQIGRIHPLLACAQTLDDALKGVADVDPVFLTAAQKREALLRLSALCDRLGGLRGRVLAAADDVAADDGARDAAAWLAHRTRSRIAPRRSLQLAHALERWTVVAAGVREGAINTEQADVIVHALDALPADLDTDLRARCEAHLVEQAAHFDPRALRAIGRRLLDVLDPDEAESREADALDREERDAAWRTYLRWRTNGDGTVDFRGRVSETVWMRLQTYLEAFTSPRREGRGEDEAASTGPTTPSDDRRPYDQKMGAALGAFLEAAVDPARLPAHGGDATTVVVTLDFDKLTSDLAAVGLIGDQPFTAGQARRLACQAGILPAVLGGASQPLDLGRTRRLASPTQRKALASDIPSARPTGAASPAPGARRITDNPGPTAERPT